MSNKIKVFLSYQWSMDDHFMSAVISYLKKLDNIEVSIDRNVVKPSDEIHKVISNSLDECDCVIVSTKSFESLEVISELVRADERGKKIFILRQKQDSPQLPGCLYFLKDILHIVYSDSEELELKLAQIFRDKSKRDFQVISQHLRKIQRSIDLSELPEFKCDLVKRILREASQEIQQLKGEEYKIDVGAEKNFLIRARSIFENADEIYAVSIDSVSTFWTDNKNKQLAESYIKAQPDNTVRLFVFTSPKTANLYRQILQANHNSYGNQGRVLLCSLHSYRNLMAKFGGASNAENHMDKDFGILLYRKRESSKNYFKVEAFLDHSELSFRNIDSSSTKKFNYDGLLDHFRKLKELGFNDYSDEETINSEKIIIKRWNYACVMDDSLWEEELRKLFPEERYGDVYHFVFFKRRDDILEERVREVRNTLSRDRETMKIKSIWFGKKTEVKSPVADFQYGSLKVGNDFEYVLFMSFKSYEDLRVYYANEKHSRLRKNLYKQLDKSLELLYGYVDEIKGKNSDKGKEIFETTIEGIVSNHMSRHDFVDKEDIRSIAHERPYNFPCTIHE